VNKIDKQYLAISLIFIVGIIMLGILFVSVSPDVNGVCKQLGYDYGNGGTFFKPQACYDVDCTTINGIEVCKEGMHRFDYIDGNKIYGLR